MHTIIFVSRVQKKITFFFQFNIVNEKMYELLGLLYKEMFQIFDPDVFHFGGDEVVYLHFLHMTLKEDF